MAAPDPTSAATALRARGLRISTARRALLEALFAGGGPQTADEIARGAGSRCAAIDRASVYRNLASFEAAGLARHVHSGQGARRWEPAARAEQAYASCEACGTLVRIDATTAERIRSAARAACGFAPDLTHFPLVGRCQACDG